jgi:integrase
MPVEKPAKVPKLRTHKATGQGYVVLNGHAIYLGCAGKPETEQRYHQVIAEWLASNRQSRVDPAEITVKELIARYWVYAKRYYRNPDGTMSTEVEAIRLALRPVRELYELARAAEFGPLSLRAVRHKMVEQGLCRANINKQTSRIKRVFKWAVSEELVPGHVYHALQALGGLRRGRCDARESAPVRPVSDDHIEAIRPHVSRQVWAIVQLQLLTAARAGEITIMRPIDIDMSGKIWVYAPSHHKTAHHGHERKIYLGPRGQEVLRPFLKRRVDAYCFSPAEAERERRNAQHAKRKTPMSCGNGPGTNLKEDPEWTPGDVYSVDAYRRAIARACRKINVPSWHPHRLRHSAATNLRREFGLETARIILGHRSAAITTIYAEADQQKAVEAMARVG